jgi:hypothetical protein
MRVATCISNIELIKYKTMNIDNNHSLGSSLIYLFIVAWLINIALHIPSFERTTFKGDEKVYLALSHSMNWDLSHYSTASHPKYSKWPNKIYRQPVFHHGPLLPLVLKVGTSLGNYSTATALFFANAMMGMLFIHLLILYRRLSIPNDWQIVGFFAVAFAPLLLFSTTRIHQDAIAGIFTACATIAFINALQRKSTAWAIWSGLLFTLALNIRFTSIISLPLVALCQLFYLYSLKHPANTNIRTETTPIRSKVNTLEHWKVFLIVSLFIATIGLQHFYRLYAAYGSIFPWDFMSADPTHPFNQFVQSRTRGKNFVNLIMLIPLFLVFCIPQTWRSIRDGLVDKDWGVIYVISTLYLLLAVFIFSYGEMRFFAAATPMFYCCLPWILARSKLNYRPFYLCLIATSFVLMIAAGYREVIVRPDEVFKIIPAIYELIPSLRKYW